MNATKQQIAKIHVLLSQLNLLDNKKEIISNYTGKRTESSRDLTIEEARNIIKTLSTYDNRDPMRRKIFALAYECDIIWGESLIDKKMNSIKLNRFLLDRGTVKKELNKMNFEELRKTVNQFGQMLKHKAASQAAKATTSLLEELQIDSSLKRNSKLA
jgi:hypothetical protein